MPPRSSKSLTKGRWRAVALSVLVHSCIVAAAVFGWFTYKHAAPASNELAIEATVVDERAVKNLAPAPKPQPPPPEPTPPPPVEEQGPPKPDPAEVERRKEEERLAAEKLEQQKREQEEKTAQELKQREAAEAEQQAAARAAAEKAAAEKKAQEKKRAEEAKQAAAEKARLAREAELRRALDAEARTTTLRNSEEAERWHNQIIARITRAWIVPPSADAGIECVVRVRQQPDGEVLEVSVESCTGGDEALRESLATAAKRASPLPAPPDPAIFDSNLRLTFVTGGGG